MEEKITGKIIKGVGGLYEVQREFSDGGPLSSQSPTVICRARGVFRHDQITPMVGDAVEVVFEDQIKADGSGGNAVIDKILPRKNQLIRPPMANLDYLFLVIAAKSPDPLLLMADKLISIAEYNRITPVVVVNKKDLDAAMAADIVNLYQQVGIPSFSLSMSDADGVSQLADFIKRALPGRCAAFAGVSGAGKSTLLNALFPELHLTTSAVSRKLGRGRHTTRTVVLYRINETEEGPCAYLADTPGFSMLDFEHFDFFTWEDLPYTFREFEQYIGCCKYTKCTHTKEEGCAILEAVGDGKIMKSRHDSFVSLYDILKNKKAWKK